MGVALKPPLATVHTQHLHHPVVGRDMVVDRPDAADEAAVLGLAEQDRSRHASPSQRGQS